MRSQLAMKILWAVIASLNSVIFVDFIIFFNTGYYALFIRPRHELSIQFLGLILGCTLLFIAIFSFAFSFPCITESEKEANS